MYQDFRLDEVVRLAILVVAVGPWYRLVKDGADRLLLANMQNGGAFYSCPNLSISE